MTIRLHFAWCNPDLHSVWCWLFDWLIDVFFFLYYNVVACGWSPVPSTWRLPSSMGVIWKYGRMLAIFTMFSFCVFFVLYSQCWFPMSLIITYCPLYKWNSFLFSPSVSLDNFCDRISISSPTSYLIYFFPLSLSSLIFFISLSGGDGCRRNFTFFSMDRLGGILSNNCEWVISVSLAVWVNTPLFTSTAAN